VADPVLGNLSVTNAQERGRDQRLMTDSPAGERHPSGEPPWRSNSLLRFAVFAGFAFFADQVFLRE
jgi:hypothetical protein